MVQSSSVYFDASGRTDVIATTNMLFFVLLYMEHHPHMKPSTSLANGLTRARDTIIHVLSLSSDKDATFWVRYYADENMYLRLRLGLFVSCICLRWPEHDFVQPLKQALSRVFLDMKTKNINSGIDTSFSMLLL